MPDLKHRSHRVRDFSIYIAIGVAVAGLAIMLGVHAAKTGERPNVAYDPWVQFGILTLGIFGYLLKWFWRYKSSVNFWLLYALLLTAHCVVFLPIFARGRWPVLTVGFVGSIEGMMLFALLATVRGRFRVHPHRD